MVNVCSAVSQLSLITFEILFLLSKKLVCLNPLTCSAEPCSGQNREVLAGHVGTLAPSGVLSSERAHARPPPQSQPLLLRSNQMLAMGHAGSGIYFFGKKKQRAGDMEQWVKCLLFKRKDWI